MQSSGERGRPVADLYASRSGFERVVENSEIVFTGALGLIHGEIGLRQQRRYRSLRAFVEGDTDRGAEGEILILEGEWPTDQLDNLRGDNRRGIARGGEIAEQQDEFIA